MKIDRHLEERIEEEDDSIDNADDNEQGGEIHHEKLSKAERQHAATMAITRLTADLVSAHFMSAILECDGKLGTSLINVNIFASAW